jgi:N utilization substance protein B
MSRRKSRQAILKLLYSWDLGSSNTKNSADKIIEYMSLNEEEISYMVEIFDRVINNLEKYDQAIEKNLKLWKLQRLAALERNILRIAVAELDDLNVIPKQIVINEAVELAKLYCDDKAYKLINGVLANIDLSDA